MALPNGEDLWIALDLEAWDYSGKDYHGRAQFAKGARTRWNQLAVPRQQQQMAHALQSVRYGRDSVTTQTANLGEEPENNNVDGIRVYLTWLEGIITSRQQLEGDLTSLRTLRAAETDPNQRVVTFLDHLQATNGTDRATLIDSQNRLQAVVDEYDREQQRVIAQQQANRGNQARSRQQHRQEQHASESEPIISPGIIEDDVESEEGFDRQRRTNSSDTFLRHQAVGGDPEGGQSGLEDDQDSDDDEQQKRLRHARGRLNTSWAGPAFVGSGAMGTCNVFVKQNADGIIVDRIVIKDAKGGQSENFKLHGPTNVPTEVAAMYQLRPLKGSDSAVRVRNWRRYPPEHEHEYRLYMEYCGHGDLETFVQNYWPAQRRDPAKPNIPAEQGQWIPEPFLWAAFESLATAGVLMLRGDLDPPLSRAWECVVHGDLKLSNVFLGASSNERYRGYPQAKLGDFGVSLIIRQDDQCLPEDFFALANRDMPESEKGFGTRNARPPEQKLEVAKREKFLPGSETNVWGVGFVLWSLIKGIEQDGLLNDFEGGDTEGRKPTTFNSETRKRYSYKLRRLIRHCLSWNPHQRPSFDQVLSAIHRYTATTGHDLARGLRDAHPDDTGFSRPALLLQTVKWPLRTALASLDASENMEGADAPPPPKPTRQLSPDVSPPRSESDVSPIPSYPSNSDDDDLGGPSDDLLNIDVESEEEIEDQAEVTRREQPRVKLQIGNKGKKRAGSLDTLISPSPKRLRADDTGDEGVKGGRDCQAESKVARVHDHEERYLSTAIDEGTGLTLCYATGPLAR